MKYCHDSVALDALDLESIAAHPITLVKNVDHTRYEELGSN